MELANRCTSRRRADQFEANKNCKKRQKNEALICVLSDFFKVVGVITP